MIIAALIGLVITVIGWVLAVLPTCESWPTGINSAILWITNNALPIADVFFPVNTLISALLFCLAIEMSCWFLKITIVIWKMVRG